MKENKLKKMAENNKFEELMNNKQELERLSKIKDISEVLDILNKYGYNGTKQDLGRDLFEILQGLSEDDLQNISGGKILNKKHLAGLMGGLTMMGAMGLTMSAHDENQNNVKPKLEASFLNKVDKTIVGVAGGSFVAGGLFVEFLNLLFRKPKIEYRDKIQIIDKNKIVQIKVTKPDFELTEEEQEIYDNTVELSNTILTYVANCIIQTGTMPYAQLDKDNPEHKQILHLVRDIRAAWIKMYESHEQTTMDETDKQKILNNEAIKINYCTICPVQVEYYALSQVFQHLPVDRTRMFVGCWPSDIAYCSVRLPFLTKLWHLEKEYKIAFAALEKQCEQSSESSTSSGTSTETSSDTDE